MCSINPAWCKENLSSATRRVLSILHTRTVSNPALGSVSTTSFTELLTAPGFAFCFPLLRCLLREGGKAVDGDEDLRYQGLQVVAEHCKLRACDDEDEEDEEEQDEVNELYQVTSRILVTRDISIRRRDGSENVAQKVDLHSSSHYYSYSYLFTSV